MIRVGSWSLWSKGENRQPSNNHTSQCIWIKHLVEPSEERHIILKKTIEIILEVQVRKAIPKKGTHE